eukprot:CAMPEP_0114682412 /NCGR_PEP_ID=MMETSP0191-20121206/56502_1 /TAXON_ID=126664 /ORGANISM="Sorites sp." /LENGTH=178 /DNA_ID=CAMNT_0001961969 /DNA_START=185 /DNA_END=721 /DNA_ORIENTATION=-
MVSETLDIYNAMVKKGRQKVLLDDFTNGATNTSDLPEFTGLGNTSKSVPVSALKKRKTLSDRIKAGKLKIKKPALLSIQDGYEPDLAHIFDYDEKESNSAISDFNFRQISNISYDSHIDYGKFHDLDVKSSEFNNTTIPQSIDFTQSISNTSTPTYTPVPDKAEMENLHQKRATLVLI